MDGAHRDLVPQGAQGGRLGRRPGAPADLSGFVARSTRRRCGGSRPSELLPLPAGLLATRSPALREQVVLVEALADGEVVASALCFATMPWLHYHLGATARPGGRSARATSSSTRRRVGASAGYERFHLGGGVGGRRTRCCPSSAASTPGDPLELARQGRARRGVPTGSSPAAPPTISPASSPPTAPSASRRPCPRRPGRRPGGCGRGRRRSPR